MSKDPHIANIFSAEDEDCLSLEQMTAYQESRLQGQEKHLVERHLVNCELCAITFESLAANGADSLAAGAEEVADRAWEQIQAKETRRRRGAIFWIASAASIALLITLGYFSFRGPSNAEIENTLADAMNVTPPLPMDSGMSDPMAMSKDLKETEEASQSERTEPFEKGLAEKPKSESAVHSNDQGLLADKRPMNLENGGDDFANAKTGAGGSVHWESAGPMPAGPKPAPFTTLSGPTPTFASAPMSESNRALNGVPSMNQPTQWDQVTTVAANKEANKEAPAKRDEAEVLGGVEGYASDDFGGGNDADLEQVNGEKDNAAGEEYLSDSRKNLEAKELQNHRSAKSAAKGKDASGRTRTAMMTESVTPNAAPGALQETNSYADGLAAYQAGDYQEAAGKLRQAAEITPDNMQAHLYAADAYLRIAQPQAALFHIDRILAVPGNSAFEDAEWYKALALLQMKEGRKAEKQLETVIARNGKYKSRAEAALKELK